MRLVMLEAREGHLPDAGRGSLRWHEAVVRDNAVNEPIRSASAASMMSPVHMSSMALSCRPAWEGVEMPASGTGRA